MLLQMKYFRRCWGINAMKGLNDVLVLDEQLSLALSYTYLDA